jgi:hypothetical protein
MKIKIVREEEQSAGFNQKPSTQNMVDANEKRRMEQEKMKVETEKNKIAQEKLKLQSEVQDEMNDLKQKEERLEQRGGLVMNEKVKRLLEEFNSESLTESYSISKEVEKFSNLNESFAFTDNFKTDIENRSLTIEIPVEDIKVTDLSETLILESLKGIYRVINERNNLNESIDYSDVKFYGREGIFGFNIPLHETTMTFEKVNFLKESVEFLSFILENEIIFEDILDQRVLVESFVNTSDKTAFDILDNLSESDLDSLLFLLESYNLISLNEAFSLKNFIGKNVADRFNNAKQNVKGFIDRSAIDRNYNRLSKGIASDARSVYIDKNKDRIAQAGAKLNQIDSNVKKSLDKKKAEILNKRDELKKNMNALPGSAANIDTKMAMKDEYNKLRKQTGGFLGDVARKVSGGRFNPMFGDAKAALKKRESFVRNMALGKNKEVLKPKEEIQQFTNQQVQSTEDARKKELAQSLEKTAKEKELIAANRKSKEEEFQKNAEAKQKEASAAKDLNRGMKFIK